MSNYNILLDFLDRQDLLVRVQTEFDLDLKMTLTIDIKLLNLSKNTYDKTKIVISPGMTLTFI